MKKLLLVFILVFACVLCGCDGTDSPDKASAGTEVVMSEAQSFKLDATNYDISDIDGIKKLGESGVIYAYCTSADGVNAMIESFDSILDTDLEKYDTENKNLVLTLITLGEGEKSSYGIDKIEMTDGAALQIYVKTNAGDPEARNTREYHFVRLDIPVCGEINVYVDGVEVGK